jgi:hypothetical protein
MLSLVANPPVVPAAFGRPELAPYPAGQGYPASLH